MKHRFWRERDDFSLLKTHVCPLKYRKRFFPLFHDFREAGFMLFNEGIYQLYNGKYKILSCGVLKEIELKRKDFFYS